MGRKDKVNYYLDIAQSVALRGTCLRRNYGAIIVKNDEIISTGYCGSPRGCDNCIDVGTCLREELKIPSGSQYEKCKSVHAEQNAIISASRKDMLGGTMYLVGLDSKTGELFDETEACLLCKKMILNAGIERIIIRRTLDTYDIQDVFTWRLFSVI